MGILTTKALQWLPSAANGSTVTPSGVAWTSSAWVQITASSAGVMQVAHLTYIPGFSADFEVDIGKGAAASEVVIGTAHARVIGTTNGDFSLELGAVIDNIPNGTRVAIRMRSDSTNVTTWNFALGYYIATDSTNVDSGAPVVTPGAQNLSAITSGSAWVQGTYLQTTAGFSVPQLLTSLSVNVPGFSAAQEWEMDVGIGASGSEVVATTIKGASIGSQGTGYYVLPQPVYIPANTRVALRSYDGQGSLNYFSAIITIPYTFTHGWNNPTSIGQPPVTSDMVIV